MRCRSKHSYNSISVDTRSPSLHRLKLMSLVLDETGTERQDNIEDSAARRVVQNSDATARAYPLRLHH
jgi:hypothetical protein